MNYTFLSSSSSISLCHEKVPQILISSNKKKISQENIILLSYLQGSIDD